MFVDGKGQILRYKPEPGFDFNMLLYYGCYIPSTATFFRKEIITQEFFLDEMFQFSMDRGLFRENCSGRI